MILPSLSLACRCIGVMLETGCVAPACPRDLIAPCASHLCIACSMMLAEPLLYTAPAFLIAAVAVMQSFIIFFLPGLMLVNAAIVKSHATGMVASNSELSLQGCAGRPLLRTAVPVVSCLRRAHAPHVGPSLRR